MKLVKFVKKKQILRINWNLFLLEYYNNRFLRHLQTPATPTKITVINVNKLKNAVNSSPHNLWLGKRLYPPFSPRFGSYLPTNFLRAVSPQKKNGNLTNKKSEMSP